MGTGNNITAFFVTDKGRLLAERLKGLYPGLTAIKFSAGAARKSWDECGSFIFIMAAGIVVRTIKHLIKDKRTDPAVVVLDENGRYAVSLLSGHLGGANERSREIAGFLKGEAVITTASDVNRLTPIDLWARDNDLVIEDWKLLPRTGSSLNNRGYVNVYADIDLGMPDEFVNVDDPSVADLIITHRKSLSSDSKLYLRPKDLIVGIGCNSGTSASEIEAAVRCVLDRYNFSFLSVGSIATIDVKAEEPGIKTFAGKCSVSLLSFRPEVLNSVNGVSWSDAAFRATGAKAVAEPAALLAAGAERLLVAKQKVGNVTVAVAEIKRGDRDVKKAKAPGKLYIVGTGPGNVEHITPYAQRAIRESDTIVGYGTYTRLIQEIIGGKKVISTGMTKEIDRCRKAVELALDGKTVAVISGGDPGIYAMAGLVFEVLKTQAGAALLPRVEVIPGISALNACAARLGAPLMHDFASISLSDRLTPWDLIEKRLNAAAMADFVIILYNPKSKGRAGHIARAREILMKHRSPETPVGIVKGAMREDEHIVRADLGTMLDHEIDMQTTVIIGNSKTFLWNNLMITPRGYENKFEY
jgi:cobalt-precorrin 5A hydrolase / cobalt-factor III methyltransferase / precorrin-3B C17-methyltransferase